MKPDPGFRPAVPFGVDPPIFTGGIIRADTVVLAERTARYERGLPDQTQVTGGKTFRLPSGRKTAASAFVK